MIAVRARQLNIRCEIGSAVDECGYVIDVVLVAQFSATMSMVGAPASLLLENSGNIIVGK
jgi:hypothetical protein